VLGDDQSFKNLLDKYGSKKNEVQIELESVNVMTMIDKLDSEYGERFGGKGMIKMIYANMSDFCHPAAGTAFAFLRPGLFPGSTKVVSRSGDRAIGVFWCMMGAFVAPTCEFGTLCLTDCL
jgi:hypothetical protein